MKGPARVEFMPVKHGDLVDLGGRVGDFTAVHEVGFKPGPARSRSGWLVLLVHEPGEYTHTRYDGHVERVIVPRSAMPKKLRSKT